MPIKATESKRLIRGAVSAIMEQIGLHMQQLSGFMDGDDWSFVIKTHALIEASLTGAITKTIGDQRIGNIVGRLPVANELTGKLAFARALNLLSAPQARFIKRLAALRNELVHDVAQTDFEFSRFVSNLSATERHNWATALTWFEEKSTKPDGWREGALTQPKLTIWVSTVILLGLVLTEAARAEATRQGMEAAVQTGEELFRQLGVLRQHPPAV